MLFRARPGVNIGRSLTLESGDVMIQFASPDVTSIQKDFHHHEGFSQNAAKGFSGFQHHEGFSQNATNEFSYYTEDESELKGIPNLVKNQAAETARKKDEKYGWMFTLQMPSYIPLMQYAENRNLRETMAKEFGKISFGGNLITRK